MTAIAERYAELRQQMDQRMLAADPKRVVLLGQALEQLGRPEQHYQVLHIAGTNGKGSTGAFIAQALRNAGYHVGHFASPAIGSDLQQTQLDGSAITATAYVALLEATMARLQLPIAAFSAFEWDVLVTLQWYALQGAQWVVLEAGLGGATDATNAILPPKAAIFTHIALDHMAILGPTVAAIAHNKAQIIKPNTTVFIAPHQAPAAKAALLAQAAKYAAPVIDASTLTLTPIRYSLSETRAVLADGTLVRVKMLGGYQLDNARTALAVGDWLIQQGVLADRRPLLAALATVQLPGRLQAYGEDPWVFLDAGHNPDAFPQVVQTLRGLLPKGGRLLVVAGFLADKDTTTLAAELASVDAVWVTTPTHPTRALPGAKLQQAVPNSILAADVHAGLAAAEAQARANDVILVAGSFYLIGELL
ncbi:bifunctional folylpolyglutamate synthase/dihydrofolate synthase [Lacticaseibacillus baoqingensis]|uniref:tetrahydrofolate synthase n=1 Tax=Lacticaseibacillus baoqingensis TaxID=2486013 RepID=A0ABW4E2U3_9LACO|nr:Mur ligase family protein [Lacticaseibacillus baoqingensis]